MIRVSPQPYDVIVVGGGPAGSSAARRAAESGASVLVLEKKRMPRRKVCGGAVSEAALRHLGEPLPPSLVDTECFGARVQHGGRVWEYESERRVAVLTTRARFDAYLLDRARHAGAEVRFDAARSLRRESGRLVVETTAGEHAHARIVVVAAGVSNPLTRFVRPVDDAAARGTCLEAEIPVGDEERFPELRSKIALSFDVARWGYGWVFHHGDHYSVGVGGLASHFRDPRSALDGYLRSLGFDRWHPSARGHLVPRGGVARTIARDGVMLAGDAAGFVDAFYGEGIAHAIRSGQLAGEAVAEAVSAPAGPERALRRYERACHETVHRDLFWSRLVASVVYRHPARTLPLLLGDPEAFARFVEIPCRGRSYREFVRWIVPRAPRLIARRAFV